MSKSYNKVNYVTSFGFSSKWRKQCVASLPIEEGHTVADLMTGMGECWPYILNRTGTSGKLIAIDFSEGMLNFAGRKKTKYRQHNIEVLNENVFGNSIPENSVDHIISGFGLKTFSDEQLHQLAVEIKRMLKPGGQFSLIDVSIPENSWLRGSYLFYVKKIIPIIGWLFLGNPENYQMLGIYMEKFGHSKRVLDVFVQHGFNVSYMTYFHGCATGVRGSVN